MTKSVQDEIQAMVDRETRAWGSQDADTLVSLFHPDMVWLAQRFKRSRSTRLDMPDGSLSSRSVEEFLADSFDTHLLVHNRRKTLKITVTEEGDGAYAVVDVDTLWRHRETGEDFHWVGRACKVYTKVGDDWKLISHTGLLNYDT